jgi:hypothetical protein
MRARDFLKEATLANTSSTSWKAYLNNMLTATELAIGANGEKASGLALTADAKEQIKKLLAALETTDPIKLASTIENTVLDFEDGSSYAIKRIHKSPQIKAGNGNSDNDKGSDKKYWNDGEVAETFLGAALFARFQSKGPIDVNSIKQVVKRFKVIPGGFSATAKRGQDPIIMTALNKPQNNQVFSEYFGDYEAFASKFPSNIKGLNVLLNASVAYVNESVKVQEALNKSDSNTGKDEIVIKTDGVSDQKGTKADLTLKVGGIERLLSLKANAVKQFGQDTGATPEVITTFFQRFLPDLPLKTNANWPDMSRRANIARKKGGEDLQAVAKEVYRYVGEAYQTAEAQLSTKLANPKLATKFVQDLYTGIIHHAQGDGGGQTLVILNPGGKKAWQELEFGASLLESLSSFRLETKLTLAGQGEKDNHILQIFGRPADSKAAIAMTTKVDTAADAAQALGASVKKKAKPVDPELLIQLRSYIQEAGPTIRNIVEMGPLLKSITEVQKMNDVDGQAPVTQPEPAPTPNPEVEKIKKLAGVKQAAPAPKPATKQPVQMPNSPTTTTLKGTEFGKPAEEPSEF